jgi:hypothetical protein
LPSSALSPPQKPRKTGAGKPPRNGELDETWPSLNAKGKLNAPTKFWHWSVKMGKWYSTRQQKKMAEQGIKQKTKDRSGHCTECDKDYVDLYSHMTNKHGGKHLCSECGEAFVAGSMRMHMKRAHCK